MIIRLNRRVFDQAGVDGGTPGGAPAAEPAASADSLFRGATAGTPAQASATPEEPAEFSWVPEKYRVNDADGKLDLTSSAQKLADGYAAAVKRIGTGDLPPEKADGYKVTIPEAFKEVPLDTALTDAFRAKAHEVGLTQKQFDLVMGEYYSLVPSLLDAKAKVTADEARAELQKVWANPADYQANLSAASRAINSIGNEQLREAIHERFGTDPVFAQFAAQFGREMREDRPPGGGTSAGGETDAAKLMATEAYRNPKHPDHARVSAQVQDIWKRAYGERTTFQ